VEKVEYPTASPPNFFLGKKFEITGLASISSAWRHDFETQKVLPHFRVSKSRRILLTLCGILGAGMFGVGTNTRIF